MFLFILTIKRELIVAFRHRVEYLNPLFFFLLISVLFPLTITADPKVLRLIGPGSIWIGLLFANMLAIESLFEADFEDGTLEQIRIHASSFRLFVLGKVLTHCLVLTLPLMLVTLLVAKLYFLSSYTIRILFLSLLLGSPILSFLCSLGAALTLGLRNRGLILILLVTPLLLPVLIFGAGAVNNASQQLPVASQLYFLAAFLSLAVTFAPMAISAALKISLEW